MLKRILIELGLIPIWVLIVLVIIGFFAVSQCHGASYDIPVHPAVVAHYSVVETSTTRHLDGAIDPNCTKEKVCLSDYTKEVRPPSNFTNALKKTQMEEWSLIGISSQYEEDHFIPLELCGCPMCQQNLWPQKWNEAREKDKDETQLHRAVCAGKMTLKEAQAEIRSKWKIHD